MSRRCLISPALAGFACIAPPLLLSASPPASAEISGSLYAGAETTTGDFGFESDTTVDRMPVGASMTAGRITLFTEFAYLRADGYTDAIQQSSSSSGYAGRLARISQLRSQQSGQESTAEPTPQTVSGWGDALIGGSLRLTPESSSIYTGLTVSATVPTGKEESGLGVGEWTFATSLDGEKRWNAFFLRATGGGLIDETGNDALAFASIGAGYDLTSLVTSTLSLNWAQSSDDQFDDAAESTLSIGFRLPNNAYLSSFALVGVTDASPDIGGGVTLSVYR